MDEYDLQNKPFTLSQSDPANDNELEDIGDGPPDNDSDPNNTIVGGSDPDNDNPADGGGDVITPADKAWYDSLPDDIKKAYDLVKGFLGSKTGIPGVNLGSAGLAGLLAYLAKKYDTAKPSGGGVNKAYAGYKTTQRPGPFAGAVPGGINSIPQPPIGTSAIPQQQQQSLQTLRSGGIVALEDGGFVMTKAAVDGAGGPQGLRQMVPAAQPITGPGTGTSDSIPERIMGPGGGQPAAVSNGEAYVPKQAVQQHGGPSAMYSLMNRLQKGR